MSNCIIENCTILVSYRLYSTDYFSPKSYIDKAVVKELNNLSTFLLANNNPNIYFCAEHKRRISFYSSNCKQEYIFSATYNKIINTWEDVD